MGNMSNSLSMYKYYCKKCQHEKQPITMVSFYANRLIEKIMGEIFSDYPYTLNNSPFLQIIYDYFIEGTEQNNNAISQRDAGIIVKAIYVIIRGEKSRKISLPYRSQRTMIDRESLCILFSSPDDDSKQDLNGLVEVVEKIGKIDKASLNSLFSSAERATNISFKKDLESLITIIGRIDKESLRVLFSSSGKTFTDYSKLDDNLKQDLDNLIKAVKKIEKNREGYLRVFLSLSGKNIEAFRQDLKELIRNVKKIDEKSLSVLFPSFGEVNVDLNHNDGSEQGDDLRQNLESLKKIIEELGKDDVLDNTQAQKKWEQAEELREQAEKFNEHTLEDGEQARKGREHARAEWHKHLSEVLQNINAIQPDLYTSLKTLDLLYHEIAEQAQGDLTNYQPSILRQIEKTQFDFREALNKLMSFHEQIVGQYVLHLAKTQISLYNNITRHYLYHRDKAQASVDTNYKDAVDNYIDFLEKILDALADYGIEDFHTMSGMPFNGSIHEHIPLNSPPAEQTVQLNPPVVGQSVISGFKYKEQNQELILNKELIRLLNASYQRAGGD